MSAAESPGTPAQPTVVLLHALGSSARMWHAQLDALSPRYRLIVPDLPGHGASPGCFTIDAAVEHLRGLLGPAPAHVVGVSLGATVALRLAERHPEAVAGLPVSGASMHVARRTAAVQRAITWALPLGSLARLSAAITRFAEAGDRETWIADMRRAGKCTQLDALRELVRVDVRPELARITARTLVCCGERDRANLASARLLNRRIPCASLRIIPGGGHLWTLERPDECTETIVRFLG